MKGKDMSKYKVGDKFIIEIEAIMEGAKFPYELKKDHSWIVDEKFLEGFPQLVPDNDTAAYNKGAEEAWEIAKKIGLLKKDGGFSLEELYEIFGTDITYNIIATHTVQEAKEKIEAWEKAKKGNQSR